MTGAGSSFRTDVNVKCSLETQTERLIRATDDGVFPMHLSAFQPPIRDHSLNHGSACYLVFRYKDMRGERMDSTVDVVKSLDICYIRPRREVKDLPTKSASADIAPNDACHIRKGRHPFCERDVKTVS